MTELIAPALRRLAHHQRAIQRDAHCPFKERLGRDARADHGHEINCVGVHRPRWLSLCEFDGLELLRAPSALQGANGTRFDETACSRSGAFSAGALPGGMMLRGPWGRAGEHSHAYSSRDWRGRA